jgi:hypothetical protein
MHRMDAVADKHDNAAHAASRAAPAAPAMLLPALPSAQPAALKRPAPRELLIVGLTLDGKAFRPSDWSERLAGAMSAFRPAGSVSGIAAFIGYSPYCVPRTVDGHKCVLVSEALRGVEVLAWDFVMNFARDNQLEVRDLGQSAAPE